MGFKSRQMPVIEVRRTMGGKDCLYFEVKKRTILRQASRMEDKYKK